ncbi:helix-turn-helix transcriptional regulator [Streptomyces sp. NPDC048301]|uniref:helix-turn-helix transcriptional regulator n=1 Tax=unclassified Streptomyces TaxID=2593676 RepID=UPI003435C952
MSSDLGIPSRPTAGADSPLPNHPSGDGRPSGSGLRSHFAELQEDLRRADASLSRLLDRWGTGPDEGTERLVIVRSSREDQAVRLNELEYGARSSLLVFQSGANTVAPVPTTLLDQETEGDGQPGAGEPEPPPADAPRPGALRYGGNDQAAYRVVVDRAFLSEPAALRALDERLAAGHEVRVVDQPLIKLVVADGETALVQLEPGRSLELRAPLALLAVELFESVWRRSRPYLREDGDLSPMDRRILQLMLSGLTDAATANQLGTSPRTVQRRVRALMDLTSVTSRVQLGWYAMRNNWV